jgi:hypothetical protein
MKKPIALGLTLAFAIAFASPARAQNEPSPPATPAPQSQPETTAPAQTLKTEELQQLVAPIALYPDPLLAEVLMASTYPLEVVEADRWLKAHKDLKGTKLKAEAAKRNWDDSIKSLTATRSVIEMMSGKLEWTQKLGDAVLAQQSDVMDAIQALRARAQAENKLETTKQQKVTVRTEANDRRVIAIEPAQPDVVYVPYYEPTVYGAWPYDDYPPYWFPGLYGWPYGLASAAIGWGIGWGIWNNWGGGCDWNNHNIHVDRNHNRNWTHNADHRRGVRYNNSDVAKRFDKAGDRRAANADKMKDFRNNKADRGRNADNKRADNRRDGKRADRNQGAKNKAGSSQRRDAKNKGGRQQVAKSKGSQRHASNTARNRHSSQVARNRQSNFANVNRGNRAQAFAGGGGGIRSAGGGGFRGASGGGGFRGGRGGGRRR